MLHVGRGNWIIVDSCVFPGDTRPAPLLYLDKMNVDFSKSVKVLVATHWHDDHIRGLGDIFKECKESVFFCSDALRADEFCQLIHIYGDSLISGNSGVNEFGIILKEMSERKKRGDLNSKPKFAVADRRIWKNIFKDKGRDIVASLYSLSPCDDAILSSKLDIRKLFPRQGENPRAIPGISPNQSSVVLWLSFADINILLGADLEEKGNSHKGWSVIIDSCTRPEGKAIFFKIPHHGSKNAHHPRVWEEMLVHDPIAVLTPFSRGKELPSNEDIKRICSNTSRAYSTGAPGSKKRLKRRGFVDKMIKETVGKIKMITPSSGHVRFRMKPSKSHTIELFGEANSLCGN